MVWVRLGKVGLGVVTIGKVGLGWVWVCLALVRLGVGCKELVCKCKQLQ